MGRKDLPDLCAQSPRAALQVICITSSTLKSAQTKLKPTITLICCAYIIHLRMLADQNVVCGSNTDQRDHFPRIQLVYLFSGIHQICIPTFPFDTPTQSDTCTHVLGSMPAW